MGDKRTKRQKPRVGKRHDKKKKKWSKPAREGRTEGNRGKGEKSNYLHLGETAKVKQLVTNNHCFDSSVLSEIWTGFWCPRPPGAEKWCFRGGKKAALRAMTA